MRTIAGLEGVFGTAVRGHTDVGIVADFFEGEYLGTDNLLDFKEAVCSLAVSHAQLAISLHLEW